jgi:hypothetical protein
MRDDGALDGSPKDIGPLLKKVREDIALECKEEITNFLWKQFSGELLRKSVAGLPEYYKEQLALGAVNQMLEVTDGSTD